MSARLSERRAKAVGFNAPISQTPPFPSLSVPRVTPDLIEYLNAVFPDRISHVEQHGLEYAKGARSVVHHLMGLLSQQEN
jgi:hypothetical protein